MAISKHSWLGVKPEAVAGTGELAPSLFIPTKSIMKGGWKKEYQNEERGDRNANYSYVNTTQEGTLDPKGDWYNDATAVFLLGIIGADTVTSPDAASAPTVKKHTFGWSDIPKSFTAWKSYDSVVHVSTYNCIEKMSFKFSADGKLLESDVSMKSQFPTVYGGTPLTPTFSTVKPFAGYSPTITISAGATTDIDEMTLEIDQKVTYWYASSGNKNFLTAYFGERSAKIDFTARFDNATNIYDRWRTGLDDVCHINFQGAQIGTKTDTTPLYQELDINIGTFTYDTCEPDLGKDNVLLKAKGTVIPTSGSLFSIYVQNTVASY